QAALLADWPGPRRAGRLHHPGVLSDPALSARDAQKQWRVLTAKVGLDGHDRGVKVVSRALRDAGFEVIYAGLRQTPEMIVEAALQEDAQVVGLSIHSGAHMTLFPRVVELLKERGADDIVVFGGGIIPEDDITELKKLGVAEIFTPGAPLQSIVDWINKRFSKNR